MVIKFIILGFIDLTDSNNITWDTFQPNKDLVVLSFICISKEFPDNREYVSNGFCTKVLPTSNYYHMFYLAP